jgi:ATP-dependent DNA ligase
MTESQFPSHRWKNIMKAYPFEEKRLASWTPPYIVQPKYDGVRCRAVPIAGAHSEGCLLLSSEENIIYSVPHLNQIIGGLGIRAELDGELYCHGMSFEDILSITSRTVNLHSDRGKIQFHCFDVVNKEPQMKRSLIIENLRGLNPHIAVAPFWLCSTLDDVKETYDRVIKLGYEGIIVRNSMGPYEYKRSLWVMKFKPKKQDTYKIVGWKEEVSINGTPKGRIGSIVMASQSGDEFAVSAGLDDDKKARLWNIREELAGKDAIVHYQHLTNKKIPKGSFNIEVID